jgi:hypothetical protein
VLMAQAGMYLHVAASEPQRPDTLRVSPESSQPGTADQRMAHVQEPQVRPSCHVICCWDHIGSQHHAHHLIASATHIIARKYEVSKHSYKHRSPACSLQSVSRVLSPVCITCAAGGGFLRGFG